MELTALRAAAQYRTFAALAKDPARRRWSAYHCSPQNGGRDRLMERRAFICSLVPGVLAGPRGTLAQQAAAIPRVGALYPGSTAVATTRIAALLEGLRGIGYTEGQHFTLEARVAEGRLERLPALAADLVRLQVAVVWAGSTAAIEAMSRATKTIPIIAVDVESDPMATGLVASLARPGGNITGIYLDLPDFSGKWLELLKEAVPRLSHVVVFWDPTSGSFQLKAAERAAKSLRLQLQILEVRGLADLDGAFRSARLGRAGGLLVLPSAATVAAVKPIADLALRHRLPATMLFSEFGNAGGLIAYGPDISGMVRQAGGLAGKVLRGAKPADMPAERPTQFAMVLNLKTATALGLTIPPSLLLRADQVIER